MKLIDRIHETIVFDRRIAALARNLAEVIPNGSRVLDVGCGNGTLGHATSQHRPDLEFLGLEVLMRPQPQIEVHPFDGSAIPFADNSFDVIMMVDVLHHTEDPYVLLREATRVASRAIIIKDHLLEGILSGPTLRFMDHVGNSRFGVALPYNYWPRSKWMNAIDSLGLTIDAWNERLGLYCWPASLLFERNMHFIARLALGGN